MTQTAQCDLQACKNPFYIFGLLKVLKNKKQKKTADIARKGKEANFF